MLFFLIIGSEDYKNTSLRSSFGRGTFAILKRVVAARRKIFTRDRTTLAENPTQKITNGIL